MLQTLQHVSGSVVCRSLASSAGSALILWALLALAPGSRQSLAGCCKAVQSLCEFAGVRAGLGLSCMSARPCAPSAGLLKRTGEFSWMNSGVAVFSLTRAHESLLIHRSLMCPQCPR